MTTSQQVSRALHLRQNQSSLTCRLRNSVTHAALEPVTWARKYVLYNNVCVSSLTYSLPVSHGPFVLR